MAVVPVAKLPNVPVAQVSHATFPHFTPEELGTVIKKPDTLDLTVKYLAKRDGIDKVLFLL
jgi:hypothetical protein